MGTGVLYARYNWMRRLPPYQFGGEMIETVTFEKSTFNELPYKYEAGTPNVAGVLGLEAALRYINETGIDAIAQHEKELLKYAEEKISEIEGVRIIGTAAEKAGALSFVVDGTHPYDIGMLLDKTGVAVRTGHHCAQPLIDFLGLPGTVRASFAMYNTFEEIDAFSEGDGGYDATMKALIKCAERIKIKLPTLIDYEVRIPKGGKTDALVETKIVWEKDERVFSTIGVDTDQIVAAMIATEKMLNIVADWDSFTKGLK